MNGRDALYEIISDKTEITDDEIKQYPEKLKQSIALVRSMACKFIVNRYGMVIYRPTSAKNAKYVERRMQAIAMREMNFPGSYSYENGKNMTLSKQPNHRRINHNHALFVEYGRIGWDSLEGVWTR